MTFSRLLSPVAFVAASLSLAAPALAQDPAAEPVEPVAAEVIAPLDSARSGSESENVSVKGSSSLTVFAGGRIVDLAAKAPDVFAAGERVTLRGEVTDNFVGAGRNVTVAGPVGGDAFLFGETMVISSHVAGDVYAMGETLQIPEDVMIGGNLYFGGATLELAGTVGGSVRGGGATVGIDGAVGGDVKLDAADVRLGGGASIGGDFAYESTKKGDIAEGASVGGAVKWTEKIPKTADGGGGDDDDESTFLGALGWRLFLFASALLVGGALLGLFPRLLTRPAVVLEEEAPGSLGVGFAVLLGVPVLALFLAVFVLPLPLSLLSMAVWVPATFVARFIAAFALGKLVASKLGKELPMFGVLALGLAVLHPIYAVPYLGALIMMVATVLGLGALFLAARRAGEEVATA